VIAVDAPLSCYQFKRFRYNSHYWILRLIEDANGPLRILDVGSAAGYLGAALKGRGHYVAGVERDAQLAEQARPFYDQFFHVDVDEWDFSGCQGFDLILFADILEHLRDPVAVLRRCSGTLSQNGKIIVSVPNVANFMVRLSLLFGRFDYDDRGILDRTHLRFFTLKTLRNLLHECGFSIERIVATTIPVQLVWPVTNHGLFAPLHYCHYLTVRLWKTLFAYQFVVQAGRREGPRQAVDG